MQIRQACSIHHIESQLTPFQKYMKQGLFLHSLFARLDDLVVFGPDIFFASLLRAASTEVHGVGLVLLLHSFLAGVDDSVVHGAGLFFASLNIICSSSRLRSDSMWTGDKLSSTYGVRVFSG